LSVNKNNLCYFITTPKKSDVIMKSDFI